QHFRAGHADRLHRDDAALQRHTECLAAAGRQGVVLPRAAGDRAHHVFLRADRYDDLLFGFVAPAGTGDRPRRRHIRLAVHYPGDGGCVHFWLVATTIYNPLSAFLDERSKRYEAELFKRDAGGLSGSNYWTSQRTDEGQAIINAKSS